MTVRRVLIGLLVAGVAVGLYAWTQRETGSVVVRFERWGGSFSFGSTPIVSIANRADREISLRGADFNGVSLGFAAENGEKPFAQTYVIQPNAKHEVFFVPVPPDVIAVAGGRSEKLPWPIKGQMEVLVVPWTDAQRDEASARYATWPEPVKAFLMRKFTAPPERYTVNIPPKPEP